MALFVDITLILLVLHINRKNIKFCNRFKATTTQFESNVLSFFFSLLATGTHKRKKERHTEKKNNENKAFCYKTAFDIVCVYVY